MITENSRNEWIKRFEAGVSLEYAPKVIQDDKDLVMYAVQKNPMNLEFASERLKRDIDIVTLATTQNVLSLVYVDEDLMNLIILCGIAEVRNLKREKIKVK